jgi:hypothetical protein
MSNHDGGHMLKEVLEMLDELGVFEWLGTEKTEELVSSIIQVGRLHDCNDSEILYEVGRKLGICAYCTHPAKIVYNDICQLCFQKHYGVDENGEISLSDAEKEWGYTQAEFLRWLQAELLPYRQEGAEYYAKFIDLENALRKRRWET